MSAEIIDIEVLRPLAGTGIVDSVKKTSRLLTVEEQPVHGGLGEQRRSRRVVAEAFDYLDAPRDEAWIARFSAAVQPPLEDVRDANCRCLSLPSAGRSGDEVDLVPTTIQGCRGATMEDAAILSWCKSAGDRATFFSRLKPTKQALTIESPVSGRLGEPAVAAGQRAPVGVALITIFGDDAAPAATVAPAITATIPPKDVTSKQGASHLRTRSAPVVGAQGAGGTERVRASPRARRLARVAGIDLSTVKRVQARRTNRGR